VRLWDSRTGQQLAALEGHTWFVLAFAFSPDGKLLATGRQRR
jgi:WD40 repeat protein